MTTEVDSIISVNGLTMGWGDVVLLTEATFSVARGDVFSIPAGAACGRGGGNATGDPKVLLLLPGAEPPCDAREIMLPAGTSPSGRLGQHSVRDHLPDHAGLGPGGPRRGLRADGGVEGADRPGHPHPAHQAPVSYTHLTLPTSDLAEISVGAVSLKKKK